MVFLIQRSHARQSFPPILGLGQPCTTPHSNGGDPVATNGLFRITAFTRSELPVDPPKRAEHSTADRSSSSRQMQRLVPDAFFPDFAFENELVKRRE